MIRNLIFFVSAFGILALVVGSARADLSAYEALQQTQGTLNFQYAFEGASDATRLADGSSNGYTLQNTTGSAGAGTGVTSYVPGFDGSSQAYRPGFSAANYQQGTGLNTVSTAVTISQTVTVEAVVLMDDFVAATTPGSGTAYILSARPQPNNNRAYFLRQGSPTGDDRVFTTLGDTFADQVDIYNPYTVGDWYYIAMTADITGANSDVTVYGANLSQGETTLSPLASDNSLFQGDWSGTSQVGIGNFLNGSQEFLQGAIDNVALYNSLLSQPTLQGHLDAIYAPSAVPEPTSGLVCGLLGTVLAFRRRRLA
jgi:hypothetical protein